MMSTALRLLTKRVGHDIVHRPDVLEHELRINAPDRRPYLGNQVERWAVGAQCPTSEVLRGTLDLLILKTLALEPMHGWGVSQQIQQLSDNAFQVGQGSLYPALQRLEQRGWIDSEWRITDQNRRAKYYHVTRSGRRALGREVTSWRDYVTAVERILEAT